MHSHSEDSSKSKTPKNFPEYEHHYLKGNLSLAKSMNKTIIVSVVTVLTMAFEIGYGYYTSSMALLAEGWHMGSHAGVLVITYFAYRLASSEKTHSYFSFGAGKFLPLGGYTNAVIL